MLELWSHSHTGIGSDGLVLIGRSEIADFSMRIFNADGSDMMLRVMQPMYRKYVYEHGLTAKKEITLETLSGIKKIKLYPTCGCINEVSVDMGEPILQCPEQVITLSGSMQNEPLTVSGCNFRGTFVSMGNPHLVIFVKSINNIDLNIFGPSFRKPPMVSAKNNVGCRTNRSKAIYTNACIEQGSGITQACGTGSLCYRCWQLICSICATSIKVNMDGERIIYRMGVLR
ncbi:MAG: diaminopimelate epimerase [Phocaeicola sp.]